MSKNKSLLDKLLLIILSAQTILMGVLFIVQILRIYFGNDKTFTKEICIEYILQILPAIIIWIILIIGVYIYLYVKNIKFMQHAKMSNYAKFKLLSYQMPNDDQIKQIDEYNTLNKELKKRRIAYLINAVIIIGCSIMGLCYLLNVNHFVTDGDHFKQAQALLIHLLPWAIISLISSIILIIFEENSYFKSCEAIKNILKGNKNKGQKIYIENNKKQLIINIVRIAVLVIAVVLIIDGIANGGANEVLRKAEAICKECIGMG